MASQARRSSVRGAARPATGRLAAGFGRFPLGLRLAAFVLLALAVAPLVLTPLYRFVPPDSTPMLARALTFRPVQRDWTPLDKISPALSRAVLVSEDARFCSHSGVDWAALKLVLREGGADGPGRGASTITMQVAKNLFLWQGAAYVRKPLEIALAHWIELFWPKRHIMEVYLNIAEWGPDGVFGAEAGARRAFGRPAAKLSAGQAALMAAALPNPILRDPKRPTARMRSHAAIVASRAKAIGRLAGCLK